MLEGEIRASNRTKRWKPRSARAGEQSDPQTDGERMGRGGWRWELRGSRTKAKISHGREEKRRKKKSKSGDKSNTEE